MLPVPPSCFHGKVPTNPVSSHCSDSNDPWTHTGACLLMKCVCVCVCVCVYVCSLHPSASLATQLLYNDYFIVIDCWQATLNGTQWSQKLSCRLPPAPRKTHTQSACWNWVESVPLEHWFAPADGKPQWSLWWPEFPLISWLMYREKPGPLESHWIPSRFPKLSASPVLCNVLISTVGSGWNLKGGGCKWGLYLDMAVSQLIWKGCICLHFFYTNRL